VSDELEDAVGGQEVGGGNPVLALEPAFSPGFLEDRIGQDQTGGLTTETPRTAVGWKDVIEDLSKVENTNVALGHRYEVQLVGEESAHQGGAGTYHILGRRHRLGRREIEELVDLFTERIEWRARVFGQPRALLDQHSFLDQQEGCRDLLRLEVALGVLDSEFVELSARFAVELRFGAVGVVGPPRAAKLEGRGEIVQRLEIDQPAPLQIHQQPAAHAIGHVGPALLEIVKLLPPFSH